MNGIESRLDRIEDILAASSQITREHTTAITNINATLDRAVTTIEDLGQFMSQLSQYQRIESERQAIVNARWELEHSEFRAALERIDRILDYLMGQGDRPS